MTLTNGQCNSQSARLDFGCGCPQLQDVLSVNVCLQGLFTGQPASPPEMQRRRVEVACRHFFEVLEDFLSQGCAVGGSSPGGIESRILSYPLLKTNSLGFPPKALAWAESWHQAASRAVLSQEKCQ